jgi:hypothetical protein
MALNPIAVALVRLFAEKLALGPIAVLLVPTVLVIPAPAPTKVLTDPVEEFRPNG